MDKIGLLKMIKIMRFTIFILLLSLSQTFAISSYSQQTKLSLDMRNARVEDIIDKIEKNSQFFFMYNKSMIDVDRKVDIQVEEKSVNEVLDKIFANTGITYSIKDRQILLINNRMVNAGNESIIQQQKSVSGKVTDSTGASIPGVSVVVKGTTVGVITDMDGKYTFSKASDEATLVFSFVGMKTQEITVGIKTTINVTLAEETIGIDEVVAIGYGTKLKGELTGSISTVDSKNLESRAVTGSMDALQGLLSGVAITKTNGQPGQENFSLTIRGISSVNGSSPLILVDGVPGDINLINTNDIKSITILKDAAAAIYGARAADGVILVTTKAGTEGRMVVSYSGNLGMKTIDFKKKMTSTAHFVSMFNEANKNDGDAQTFSDETIAKIAANDPGIGPGENQGLQSYPMWYQSRDWYGALWKTALIQSHTLSITGGSDKTTYFLSGNYLNNNGNISMGTNYSDKYNYRLNVLTKLRDNLKLNAIVSYDNQKVVAPSGMFSGQDNVINNALTIFSYLPEFNPAGNYYTYQGYQNPFQAIDEGGAQITNDSRLNSNLKIDWTPIKGLVWTGQAALNIENYRSATTYPTFYGYNWDNSINGLPRNSPNSAQYSNWSSNYKNFNTYLNYNTILFNKHSINLMAGASQERRDQKSMYMSGTEFLSNQIFVLPLSNPKNLSAGSYWNNNSWALLSYFGRFSYTYNDKYYLDATIRKDGSSKFAPEKRWSETYPSILAGWKISSEPFYKSAVSDEIIDLLKVRASWGRTGNQEISSLGLFDYYQLITIGGTYPIDGTTVSQLASMNGIASPTRTWETIETKNLGFDFGFFHSKLTASFDIYQKKNTNMLVSIAYPSTLGTSAPTTNAGNLLINGWEFQGNWKSMVGKDFSFNVGFLLNYNSNKLTKLLGNDTYSVGRNFARQGYPLNSFFGYKGSIIRTQAELDAYAAKFAGKGIIPATKPNGQKGLGVGDVMYQDMDGDGVITTFGDKTKGTTGDAVFLGSADPKYTYSLNAGIVYKSFDLSLLLQGTGDKYDWRSDRFGVAQAQSWFQSLDYFYGKTFTADNLNAPYPRISNSGTVKSNNYKCSSVYLLNTKYLRFKNIQIGYTFPKEFLSKLKISSARIYISGENLLTLSKDTWDHNYDPEESNSEYNYPLYKTFSLGLNLNF